MDVQPFCEVKDCDKPLERKGFCYGHYMKNWRYGTPTPQRLPTWTDIANERFGSLVALRRLGKRWECLCDCGKTRVVSVGDLNRYGHRSTCGDRNAHRRNDSGYGAAHWRCVKDRGPSTSYSCVDCGEQARQWSYNHDDPNELLGTSGLGGQVMPFSLKPEYYSPRCVPCHKRFDLNRP